MSKERYENPSSVGNIGYMNIMLSFCFLINIIHINLWLKILSLEMNILQEPLPQEIMNEILEFGRILQLYTHFVCSDK